MIPLQITSRIFNTPLMITPEKLEAIVTVLNRETLEDIRLDAAMASAFSPESREPNQGIKGIAVVPVIGSLVARSSGFSGGSGLRSYASIKKDLNSVMNDPEIGGIMLDIDSHGGEVSGLFSLCETIRDVSAVKPVYGFANESAYSAGYALLAACDRVFVTPTSGAGSVGCLMKVPNQAEKDKKDGMQYEFIYSGKKKVDGNPHAPMSDAFRADMQAKVDTLRGMFAEKVDAYRGLKAGDAMKTEAGTYLGEEIVKVGFADTVATWEEALAELSAKINQNQRGSKMTTQERMAALIANNDDAPEALAALGFVPAASVQINESELQQKVDDAVAASLKESVAGIRAEAGMVCELCDLAGIPDAAKTAAKLIKDGITLEQAQVIVLEGKAAEDKKTVIGSVVGSGTQEPNTFLTHLKSVYPGAQA